MGRSSEKLEKKTKQIFFGLEFINGIRRVIFFTLALLYFISLGYNPVKVIAMFAVSRIILAMAEFPTGAFADYYSRKKSIVISFFLMGLGLTGMYFFRNFWILSLLYILNDIGWSFQSGITPAWAIDTLRFAKEHKKITSLLARFTFFERVGAVVGGIIAFFVVAKEFSLVWLFIGLMCIFTSAVLAIIMPEQEAYKKGQAKEKTHGMLIGTFTKAKESIAYILHKKNKQLQGIALASFLAVIALNAFYLEAPLVLTQILGLTPNAIAGIKGLIGVVILAAPVLVELLAHKIGFRRALATSFIGIFAAITVFALSRNVMITIIAWTIMYVLDNASSIINDSAVQHRLNTKNRATLGSAMNAIWSVSDALAAGFVSIGLLVLGLVPTTLLSGLMCIVAAAIYFATFKI
jgi:MFS family permease